MEVVYEEVGGNGDALGMQTANAAHQHHLSTSSVAGLLKESKSPFILCHSLKTRCYCLSENRLGGGGGEALKL